MRSDLLLFLVWILFLLGTQLLKKKKRPLKKVLPPVRRQDPGSFVCEEAQAPAVKEPPLQPLVKPVHSDLVEEIRDLKPSVAPQVAETRQRRPEPVRHPALSSITSFTFCASTSFTFCASTSFTNFLSFQVNSTF